MNRVTTPARRPSFVNGAIRIFEMTTRQMVRSPRTAYLLVIAAAPLLIALAAAVAGSSGELSFSVNGRQAGRLDVFGLIIWLLFFRFIVPVLGVFYGISLMADEIENKTITYLFTRPIRRGAILLGKYFAYLIWSSCSVVLSLATVFLLMAPEGELLRLVPVLFSVAGVATLGVAVYGAVFTLVGTLVQRPLVVGLVFVFGWEQVVLLMPGSTKQLTIAYHLQALLPGVPGSGSLSSSIDRVVSDASAVLPNVVWLLLLLAASLTLAVMAIERREYVLQQ